MINLIRRDLVLLFSSKSTIITLLLFIPLFSLILGMEPGYSIVLLSIVTLGYMLTLVSFNFEVKNKPYVSILSLPIKRREVVISKYIEIFINYIIAVVFAFIYSKILSVFGVNITGNFDIFTLKQAFLILIVGLSISLPLQFLLPPKIANFINTLFYISILNYFSVRLGDEIFENLSGMVQFTLSIVIFFISMGLSILLYKKRDLS